MYICIVYKFIDKTRSQELPHDYYSYEFYYFSSKDIYILQRAKLMLTRLSKICIVATVLCAKLSLV